MDVKDFIAADIAVVLPNKSNPKVYLAIGSVNLARLSFQLYNPFSLKGKMFKWVASNLCVHANYLARVIMPTIKNNSSGIIQYLQKEFGIALISSVYIATAKDKVVAQLINDDAIYGYLKYPLTSIGKKRLENERRAIGILSQKGLVSELLYSGNYNTAPFIVLKNIQGVVSKLGAKEYAGILNVLEKNKSFMLREHPRVLAIQQQLIKADLIDLNERLSKLMDHSTLKYKEVYEHGDFAPWNIIQTDKGLVPFDFEYFEEIGLEHLDELKYHFQIEHLLNAKKGADLIKSIATKVTIPEFEIIFQIFLIKEVLNRSEEKASASFENSLLQILPAANF